MDFAMDTSSQPQLYFVDETGDCNIFSNKGKIIIGEEGCSRFFILGLLEIGDLSTFESQIAKLRTNLIADPYFKGVPSMQVESRKTALAFHAKDDLPEVRREVFELLRSRSDLSFFAVVSDKLSTLAYIQNKQSNDSSYRYTQDEAYDFLVRRIFKHRLHQSDEYKIVFAKRGNRDRNRILREQLEITRLRFEKHPEISPKLKVASGSPKDFAGLQAVDYFLWALQRVYERNEDRFLIPLWHHCKLVHDIHDNRRQSYGEYYDKRNPLTRDKIEDRK